MCGGNGGYDQLADGVGGEGRRGAREEEEGDSGVYGVVDGAAEGWGAFAAGVPLFGFGGRDQGGSGEARV